MAKFLIHYAYPTEVFAGSLWLTPSSTLTFQATLALTAEFEPYRVILPTVPAGQTTPATLSLTDLPPRGTPVPTPLGISPTVTNVSVRIDRTGLSFSGYVDNAPPPQPPAGSKSVPTINSAAAGLSTAYEFKIDSTPSSFTVSLSMAINVTVDGQRSAEIGAAVSCDSRAGTWSFQG